MGEIQVSLTSFELEIAALIGSRRQIQNLYALRTDAHGAEPDRGWQYHLEGAAGEMAVAKWRDRYWNGNLGNLKADDVGTVQVRTRSRHDYCLLLHKTDHDDKPYISVSGLAPHFVLRGWIWGREGKLEKYWSDPKGGRPAYFVPQSVLRPMPGGVSADRREAHPLAQ
jgi:hypothetical protein